MSDTTKGDVRLQELKTNLGDAAWRSAARTAVSLMRKPLLDLLGQRVDKKSLKGFQSFLASQEGEAVLSTLVGLAPLFIPQASGNPRIERLCREMRVAGMQVATDQILDKLIEPLTHALRTAVERLPVEHQNGVSSKIVDAEVHA